MKFRYIWLALAILFLFDAFNALVLGLSYPAFGNPYATFNDRVIHAFVSIVIAAVIITYTRYLEHD